MTLGTLGAVLIVVLAWMCWRDRRGMAIAFAAILLGVIIAGSHGSAQRGQPNRDRRDPHRRFCAHLGRGEVSGEY